jgi:holo-[acyl-carrier protein] synthase
VDGVFVELLLGTDIIEVDRVKTAIENGENGRFLNRVFTPNEIEYCESKKASKYQSYAARFAGKEAVSKAFGTGIGENAFFNEIEILNNALGKPSVTLHGKAKEYYSTLGASGISITLSHCREYAVAYVAISVGKC